MATTATLNGGPTGGLHTTPTLIHSEEPPQDETCRVESNSSFESGHEDLQTVLPLDQGETSSWVCGGEVGKSSESHSFFMESHNSTNSLLEAKGKKRRKQSRPIRIPASEFMDIGATTGATIAAAAAMDTLEAGELPLPCFRRNVDDESEESPAHSHHHNQHSHRKHLANKGHSQVPLNLSKNEQHHTFSEEQQHQQQHHHLHHPHMDCQQPISSSLEPVQTNSSIENDKTEQAGQGTKDSFSTCNPITSSGSPPNPLPPSFSPGLFPLSSSSPFSALFPSAVGFFSQHQQLSQQQQQQTSNTTTANQQHHRSSTTPNPPSGTPTSSSSAGSNHLGGSSHQNVPPHRIFNPEAYCDLCNKEFCNKYFLKTHKANKHGVYSELPQSLGMTQSISSSSPSSSYLTTPVLSVIPSLQQQQQQQQQSQQQQSSQTALVSVPLSSSSSKGGGLGPGTEIPFSVAFSMEKSGNSNGSQQRESFCELCQKEFCNKYFLKKHKAKIHGIPMESSSRSSSSGRSQRDSFSNGVTEKRSGEGSCCGISGSGMATLRDIKLETLGLDMVSKHMEDSCGVGGVGVDDGRGEEGELGHSDESRTGMNLISGGQCELSAAGNVDMKTPENTRDSDENSSFKISSLELKLPQLGAVNAENTCQFCFRDFASKNLLRSHLVKKHRLLLPSFPPFLLPFGNMPSLFDDGAESAGTNLDNNGNATEIDHECNLCNRTFQTIYLLRMHKSYFHPDSEEAADPETSKLITEAANLLGVKSADEAEPGLASDPESGKNTPNDNDNGGGKSRKIRSAAHLLSAVEMENRGEGTSDSDDLRRLQTMIMELNRVSSASVAAWSPPLDSSISPAPLSSNNSSTLCHICSKEFYSTYFLQQHIQHYHTSPAGVAVDSGIQIKTESPNEITSTTTATNNNNNTPTPGKKGSNSLTSGESRELPSNIVQGALKERLLHTSESLALELGTAAAGNLFLAPGPKGNANAGINTTNNNNGANNKVDPNSAAANNAKRPSPSLSRSYCTICHKELCNKYFMRTHMLKMHGISIESSTGLGGVTCDICNKELCSKYFLKVHKQNTHGIVEEGPSPPNPSTPGPIGLSATFPMASTNTGGLNLSTGLSEATVPVSQPDAVPLLPNNQLDLTNRYFCHYSEVCPFCGRRFRSAKWLKTHLLADHGQEGRDRWKSIEKTLSPSRRQSKVGKGNAGGNSKMGSGGSGGGSNKAASSHKNISNSRDANKCALCGFSTADMESMKVHLIKEHGNQLASGQAALVGDAVSGFQDGQRGVVLDPLTMLFQKMEGGTNKMYRCAYCPFTTSLLVYLYAHERTHTGLATSVTSPASTSTQDTSATFQCPMCFHTFQQAEAFQQHLIGHQMSGVLAPFFTPTTSASGRLAFLATPPGSDPSNDPAALLSLPLLNGNSSDNLYWALKNASNGKSNGENTKSSAHHPKHSRKHVEGGDDEDEDEEDEEDDTEPPAHPNTSPADVTMQNENISGEMLKPRKRGRISHFRCSHCQVAFKSREECAAHIQQTHTTSKQPKSRRKKSFRCRKCKFFSSTYHMLLVHSRIHHSILRDSHLQRGKMERSWKMKNLPEGRGIPQEGVGDGEFVMQGFLLTSSEEESSNQSGYFVPSLVYLPVREKVSQSIRVSFSLTPTS